MATIGTYDNVVTAGAASVAVTGIAGSPSSYKVYDGDGVVIAEGAVSGSSVTIPAPDGEWPPGWALICFLSEIWNGAYGYVTDAVQVTSIRDDVADLPGVPAVGTSPAASDPNNRGLDEYLHAFTVMGPQRWQINDAAHPTVYTAGSEQGGTIAAIQANLDLDAGAAGYTNPTYADPVRPRPQFVQFPTQLSSVSGYAAGVTATVAALGPGTAYGVEFFEGLNEPQGEKGITAAQSATQYNAFRAAVKAGHADALAMGPCEVSYAPDGSDTAFNPKIAALATWLAAVTPGTLDAFSAHDYNAYNGDFLVTDEWLAAIRDALADADYPPDLPAFLTENSVGPAWQMLDVRRIVQWMATLYFSAERYGIPKEHISWFFDSSFGFQFPNWIKDTTGDLRPMALFFRVYSEELFAKAYDDALDFGTIGNSLYRGNVYRGTGGTCVALYAQGNPEDTATLAVSDTGTLTWSDWQGKTSTIAVTAGHVTLPISDLPIYLRLSPACTVSVIDVGNGLIAGSPTNIAGAATATSGTGSPDPDLVNDGVMQTGGYLPGPDFVYTSTRVPDSITLTWSSPQAIKKVLIRQVPPWANYNGSSAMIRGKLEYWNGSGWVPCHTVPRGHWDDRGNYSNESATTFIGIVGGESFMPTWYDQNWCHNVDLAVQIKTTRLRWTVTEVSYGTVPTKDAAAFVPFGYIDFENTQPRLMVSEILVLQGSVPADVFLA